ncbi:MAG: hypothetical protein V1494_01470 [Candidatus Diapherotrites archaeon]
MAEFSGMADEALDFSGLSASERRIFEIICNHWPISSLELAEHFSEDVSSREHKKRASTKYAYYLKKLVDKRLVLSKRVGNALIVWPLKVEKYRTIDQILALKVD